MAHSKPPFIYVLLYLSLKPFIGHLSVILLWILSKSSLSREIDYKLTYD